MNSKDFIRLQTNKHHVTLPGGLRVVPDQPNEAID